MLASSAGAGFTRRELTIDDPAADEVLVRVEAVGMCHADLAVRAGEFPFPLPGVAGHEGAGLVEAVGAGVTSVRPGDRVMLTFDSCGHACGRCPATRRAARSSWRTTSRMVRARTAHPVRLHMERTCV